MRETAMKWWNAISLPEKFFIVVKYKKHLPSYPDSSIDTLTGWEIELLYDLEH